MYHFLFLNKSDCDEDGLLHTLGLDSYSFWVNGKEAFMKVFDQAVAAHFRRSVFWDDCEKSERVYLDAKYNQRGVARQNGAIFDTYTRGR